MQSLSKVEAKFIQSRCKVYPGKVPRNKKDLVSVNQRRGGGGGGAGGVIAILYVYFIYYHYP